MSTRDHRDFQTIGAFTCQLSMPCQPTWPFMYHWLRQHPHRSGSQNKPMPYQLGYTTLPVLQYWRWFTVLSDASKILLTRQAEFSFTILTAEMQDTVKLVAAARLWLSTTRGTRSKNHDITHHSFVPMWILLQIFATWIWAMCMASIYLCTNRSLTMVFFRHSNAEQRRLSICRGGGLCSIQVARSSSVSQVPVRFFEHSSENYVLFIWRFQSVSMHVTTNHTTKRFCNEPPKYPYWFQSPTHDHGHSYSSSMRPRVKNTKQIKHTNSSRWDVQTA